MNYCVEEHNGSLYCITQKTEYHLNILFLDFYIYWLNRSGTLLKSRMGESFCKLSGDIFVIRDIGIYEEFSDKGYGSLLLDEILKCAKFHRAKVIKGNIFNRDINTEQEKEKLFHFYRKHGFDVTENGIRLELE